MKQFFISFLGTLTALLVAVLIFVLVIAGMFSAAVSIGEKTFHVKTNSVLHIKLDTPINDRGTKNPFKNFDFGSMKSQPDLGLNDILENIKQAKTDSSIRGIYIDISFIPSGIATVEAIRNSLLDFKKSGKFIISYSEFYTQKAYYLASVSDKIYLNPQGLLEWKGISTQVMFFKGLFNKLDVDMQIFRHGKFKSAVEPFDLEKMSAANRKQTMAYTGSIWDYLLKGISAERKISVDELNKMADDMLIENAESAVKYGLADELKFKDEVLDILKSKLSIQEKDKINFVSIGDYDRSVKKINNKTKEKIAVVYAEGEIRGGDGDDEVIGSERISKALRDARTDTTIKAIVLRVNSPGGSALASDVIWREVLLTQKVKPIIVSMGNVAASGGYYIACAADAIVAEPNTITGSIGVFGLLPNLQKFYNNKLGITIDTANTNRHSDIGSVFRPVKPEEAAVIQKSVEKIYTDFITKVADGRKMTPAEVDSIGQGRVWSGIDAKKIGLVDELGGIEVALAMAAKKAKLENYKLVELPKLKDAFEELLKEFSGDDGESKIMQKELGEYYQQYKYMKSITNLKGVQARLPYDIVIE